MSVPCVMLVFNPWLLLNSDTNSAQGGSINEDHSLSSCKPSQNLFIPGSYHVRARCGVCFRVTSKTPLAKHRIFRNMAAEREFL